MLELCGRLTYLESLSGFETKHRYVTVRYPDAIENNMDPLSDYVQKAESALYMENGESDATYLMYFDTASFAVQYLLQEFMKNADTELNSQYIYISNGGKIKAGPGWDFGLGMYAPCDTPLGGADLLHIKSLNDYEKIVGDMWFETMDSHEDFHELTRKMYIEEFYHKAKKIVESYREIFLNEFKAAADMDSCIWGASSDPFIERMELTAAWMNKRLDFLYEYYQNEKEYCLVTFKTEFRFDIVFPVKRGSRLGWIPDEGIWRDESGMSAREEITVVSDMEFYRIEE